MVLSGTWSWDSQIRKGLNTSKFGYRLAKYKNARLNRAGRSCSHARGSPSPRSQIISRSGCVLLRVPIKTPIAPGG